MNIRLKELRNHTGLSQKDFGNKIFLSQDHISSLETSRRTLTNRSIKGICNKFNVNEEWLRFGNGKMFKDDTSEYIKERLRMLRKKLNFTQKEFANSIGLKSSSAIGNIELGLL